VTTEKSTFASIVFFIGCVSKGRLTGKDHCMVEKIGVGLKNDLPAGFLFDGTKVTACKGQCHPVLPHSNFYFLQKNLLSEPLRLRFAFFANGAAKAHIRMAITAYSKVT